MYDSLFEACLCGELAVQVKRIRIAGHGCVQENIGLCNSLGNNCGLPQVW